jgi:glutamyl-tRNA reductase
LPLGLDSRDVGETEIKFQLTNAFEKALGHGFAGNYLIKLISKVLLISKKIRNKTGLFPIGRTVAGAAVKIIKDHSDRKTKIIIIGENKDAKDLYRKLLYNKYRKVRYFYDADDFRNKFIFEEELFVVVFVADNIIESVEAILETLADYTNIILITNAELNKVKHPGNVQLFEKNRVSTFLENEKIKQQRIVSEAEKHIQLEIQNFIMQ